MKQTKTKTDRMVISQSRHDDDVVRKGMQGQPLRLFSDRGLWQFLLHYGLQAVLDEAPKFRARPAVSGDFLHMPEAHVFSDRIGGGVRVSDIETGNPYDIQCLAVNAIFPEATHIPYAVFGVRFDHRGLAERFRDYFTQAPDWTLRFMQTARAIYAKRAERPIPFILFTLPDAESLTSEEIKTVIQKEFGISVTTNAINKQRERLNKRSSK